MEIIVRAKGWVKYLQELSQCSAGWPSFNSRQVQGLFLFTTVSRLTSEPTQPLIQSVPRTLHPGAKRSGREGGHSPPSGAEVRTAWSYTSTPPYVCMAWYFVKHRDNFTVTVPVRWHRASYRHAHLLKGRQRSLCCGEVCWKTKGTVESCLHSFSWLLCIYERYSDISSRLLAPFTGVPGKETQSVTKPPPPPPPPPPSSKISSK
jgi:hypothetical protein